MKRLAVVASHVIQYQDPFFRLLAAEKDLDVEVLYCSPRGAETYRDVDMGTTLRWDLDLLQGYRYRFLRNFGFGEGNFRLINPGIVPALMRGKYDAALITTGWGSLSSLLAIAACIVARIPILLFGDSAFPPPARGMRGRLRAMLLRALFHRVTAFMTSGALNADYYRHYGADPARFFPLPWAIDNERFARAAATGDRGALRARYGIDPDRMLILFSAKLIERKDPFTLLRAFERMELRDRAALVFMGDGILRAPLETAAPPHTHFLGFVNQSEIPQHYAMADVFVLPSHDDPRATVVNEAMSVGLPVVITDRCGPMGDIVRDGDNGFVISPGDVESLAAILDRLAENPSLRDRMGERSREIIATWDYAAGVRGVKEALAALP